MGGTAERLMDLAEARIREAGYGGFSFRDLAAEIGIKSASVHHHFPTKAGMAAAVVRRYRSASSRSSLRDMMKAQTTLSRSIGRRFVARSNETVGCA